MTTQALFVLVCLASMIMLLAYDKMRPGMTFFTFVIILMVGGIITPSEAIAGFSNKGMITVAILFLVSEGIRQTGALNRFISLILPPQAHGVTRSLGRMLPSIAVISAFLNNTAVVVIFAPIIKKWAESVNLPSTKFLIPLSYATILGGVCTLIGTSTNLVVHGMMLESGYEGFSMFELGKVGGIIAIVGIIYIIIASNYLLPGDRSQSNVLKESKEYTYDITIPEGSRFIGEWVRHNEIKSLPQLEVNSINRMGNTIKPNAKTLQLESGDTVTLKGRSDSIERLLHTEGITLTCLKNVNKEFIKTAKTQVEAVIAPRFSGINKKLGEFDFHRHYGAIVMAVHRSGERITTELDQLKLREGDNLILLTDSNFIKSWGDSSVFYLVSEVGDFIPPSNGKGRMAALMILLFMIVGATLGENMDKIFISATGNDVAYYLPALKSVKLDMFYFAAISMILMAWLKLFPQKKYTKFVSWDILIAIACAFAISKAMINSGIATIIAKFIIDIAADLGPYGVLAALFIITNICTEIVTNNAAAALSFPIALAVSEQMGLSPYPFFVAICIAASSSFSTPIGYQTNLIVQSVGQYKFKDYIRIGLPLNVIALIISVIMIPVFWEF